MATNYWVFHVIEKKKENALLKDSDNYSVSIVKIEYNLLHYINNNFERTVYNCYLIVWFVFFIIHCLCSTVKQLLFVTKLRYKF